MRAWPLVLAACSAPTGAAQTWPPPLGIEVAAAISTDLDGDGSADVIVAGAGKAADGGGFYLAKGDTDIAMQKADPLEAFTRFVPRDIVPPAAFTATSAGLAFAHTPDDVELVVLDENLADTHAGTIGLPGAHTLWFADVKFPGDQPHLAVGTESRIQHVKLDSLTSASFEVNMIPPPMGMDWNNARAATGFSIQGEMQPYLSIAVDTEVQTGPIPMMPPFVYTAKPHPNNAVWAAQVSADIDGDGRREFVGLDLAMHRVCAIDAMTGVVHCISVTMQAGTPALVVGNIAAEQAPDLLVAFVEDTVTHIQIFGDLSVSGSDLVSTGGPPAADLPIGGSRFVTLGMAPSPIIVIGADGASQCLAMMCQ